LSQLNEHKDNLLSSDFIPRAVSGQRMHAVGKMRAYFQLAGDDTRKMSTSSHGVIISWRAAKALKILSPHYPLPPPKLAPS